MSIAGPPKPYTYVLIPADDAQPIAERTALTAPLEEDSLKLAVAAHFGPAADQDGSGRSVEITLLTVPLASNGFQSVSLYSDPAPEAKQLPPNARATALAVAAGHAAAALRGDAFLSRVVDDEAGDVWERRDLRAGEAAEGAPWVAEAKAAIAARGASGFSSAGLMAQLQGAKGGGGGGGGGGAAPAASSAWVLSNGADPRAYAWRLSGGGELEVRQPLPAGVRAKDLKVVMTRGRVGVALKAGGGAADALPGAMGAAGGGALAVPIDAEASNWTVEGGAALFTLVLAGAWGGKVFAD